MFIGKEEEKEKEGSNWLFVIFSSLSYTSLLADRLR